MSTRRSLITGLASLIAAPSIVKAGSIMPVRALPIVPAVPFVEAISAHQGFGPIVIPITFEAGELVHVEAYDGVHDERTGYYRVGRTVPDGRCEAARAWE